MRFFKIYGRDAADIIRQHPYRLCEVRGIGFKTADEIAKSVGFDPCGEERIDAALLHVLKEAENGGSLFKNAGNLCIPKAMLLAKCIELLETPAVTEPMVRLRCRELLDRKEITLYQDQAYRYLTAKAEEQVAMRVRERIRQGDLSIRIDLDAEINRFERKLGVTLSAEQKAGSKDLSALANKYHHRRSGYGQDHDTAVHIGDLQEAQAFRIRRLLCTNRKSGTAHGAGNRTIGLYNSQGAGSARGFGR